MAAARHGFQSHGVELNWWLVMYSRLTAVRSGLKGRATFARQDLWKSNLAPYGNAVIFGVEEMVSFLHLTTFYWAQSCFSNDAVNEQVRCCYIETSHYLCDVFQMPQLETKLSNELQTGSAVVACRFPFPTWIPDETVGEGIDTVWLYKRASCNNR